MKPIVTALEVQVEFSVFNDENKLVTRPRVPPIVVFQADIPPDVLAWVEMLVAKMRGA